MLADTDGDGREQVPIEMIQLSLTGTTTCAGGQPVTLTLRDPSKHPNKPTVGEIEETTNATPGTLDLPPFTASGTADSFFDVFFEVQIGPQASPLLVLHNHTPKHMESTITHKPPSPGDMYQNPDVITLYNENEQPVMTIGPAKHIPNPTTTTTSTSSTTSTTTGGGCTLQSDPQGPICGGTCLGTGEVCLWDRPNNQCHCVKDTFSCAAQPSAACPNGFCARPTQNCQPQPPAGTCGCTP
jgi:hypothetical protein